MLKKRIRTFRKSTERRERRMKRIIGFLAVMLCVSFLVSSVAIAAGVEWWVIKRGSAPCKVTKVNPGGKVTGAVAGPFPTREEAQDHMKKASGCRSDTFK